MRINDFLIRDYPIVEPYAGVNSIESTLAKNGFVVVLDEDQSFRGILTPIDIIERPRKIVIDCLGECQTVHEKDSLDDVIQQFEKNKALVIPVISEEGLVGVFDKVLFVRFLHQTASELQAQVEVSNRLKKRFINNLSHEVRTPLNGILGIVGLLNRKNAANLDPFVTDDYLRILNCSTERFLLTMNNLIELSLLQTGNSVDFSLDPVCLDELFYDVRKTFTFYESLYHVPLQFKICIPENKFTIFIDRAKIKSILIHLVENAIKNSNNDVVTIGFSVDAQMRSISIFVKNSGSNISSEIKDNVFLEFESSDSNARIKGGLGIGLALAEKYVKLMGGLIFFEYVGGEVIFIVEFPLIPIKEGGCIKYGIMQKG